MPRLFRNPVLVLSSVLSLAVLGVACSGGGGTSAPPFTGGGGGGGTASAYVFFGDAPPPGSSVLSFEIMLTGATLCPQVGTGGACQGTPQVSLLSQPVEIELKQLELESAFLSLKSVPAGSYAGVQLTFASPELKLLLADGTTVQELHPPLNPATATPTFPGGIMVTGNTNFGFLVDFNVNDSIQTNGSGSVTGIAPAVSLVELPAQAEQEIEELEDVTGTVSNLSKTCPTGSFTLTPSSTDVPIANISFDSQTEFEGFTCNDLANGQVVEVDVALTAGQTLSSASFHAKKIELANEANEDNLEGQVFQVNSASQFVLLVQEEENVPNTPPGSFVTVTLDGSTVFAVDPGDLSVPSGLTFAAGSDLLAGQAVEVDVKSGTLSIPTGVTCGQVSDNCAATAEKLKLKKGSLTATVGTVNDPNFTLVGLPSLFGDPATNTGRPLSADCQDCLIQSVLVSTSGQTEFEGVSNVAGLAPNNVVTVRGLLFKNGFSGPVPGAGSPQLLAGKVRRRP